MPKVSCINSFFIFSKITLRLGWALRWRQIFAWLLKDLTLQFSDHIGPCWSSSVLNICFSDKSDDFPHHGVKPPNGSFEVEFRNSPYRAQRPFYNHPQLVHRRLAPQNLFNFNLTRSLTFFLRTVVKWLFSFVCSKRKNARHGWSHQQRDTIAWSTEALSSFP